MQSAAAATVTATTELFNKVPNLSLPGGLPTIPGAVMVGAGVAAVLGVAIAAGAKKEWLKHKAYIKQENTKALFDAIQFRLELRDRYLKGIDVKDFNKRIIDKVKCPSFPYHLDDLDNPTKAEHLEMTDEFHDDMKEMTPDFPDAALTPAFRNMLNAINNLTELLSLEETYLKKLREEAKSKLEKLLHSDLERNIQLQELICSDLNYFLLVIALHCLRYSTLEKNIAYTGAIARCIQAYASFHKPEKESTREEKKRFQHLTLVVGELLEAEISMTEYLPKQSLESLIHRGVLQTAFVAERMIKDLVKMSVQKEFWPVVDSTTLSRLASNMIKPRFDYDQGVIDNLLHKPHAIVLVESPFQIWIDRISRHFLLAENIPCGREYDELPISRAPFIANHPRYSARAVRVLNEWYKDKVLTEKNLHDLEKVRYYSDNEIENFAKKEFTEAEFLQFVNACHFSDKTVEALRKEGLHQGLMRPRKLKDDEIKELKHVVTFSKLLLEELAHYKHVTLTANEIQKLETERLNEKELSEIKRIFALANNFFTLEPKLNNVEGLNSFTLVTDNQRVVERSLIYSDFASLINKLILLYHYELYLWNRAQQLGEIYMSDPHHCNFIFSILDALGKLVYAEAKAIENKIDQIDQQNSKARVMHDVEHADIIDQIKTHLGTVTGTLKGYLDDIQERHQKWSPNVMAIGNIDTSKDRMFELAAKIMNEFKIEMPHTIDEIVDVDRKPIKPLPVVDVKKGNDAPPLDPIAFLDEPGSIKPSATSESTPVTDVEQQEVTLDELDNKMKVVRQKALDMPKSAQQEYCLQLFRHLNQMRERTLTLENDNRHGKAGDMRCLLNSVLGVVDSFLTKNSSKNRKDRSEAAKSFCEEMRVCLHEGPFSAGIDKHSNYAGRVAKDVITSIPFLFGFWNAYQRGGYFCTDLRAEANWIEEYCRLIKTEAPIVEEKAEEKVAAISPKK